MSLDVLESVRDAISDASLLTGYAQRYFQWTDGDINGSTPFILFRLSGGQSGSLIEQQPEVSVILVGTPAGIVAADARMADIARLFRESDGFDQIGMVMGPNQLENGRPVFSMVVRVYTESL